MLRKILYSSLLLLCPAVSFAGAYFGPGLIFQQNRADNVNYEGISPALFAGYGDWFQGDFYIAGEAFVSSKAIAIGKEDSDQLSLKTGVTYGLSLVPGINLDNTLLAYFRIGYLRANFPSLDEQEGTYQFGVGLETQITGCWKARLEYDYVPFRSVLDIGTIQTSYITLSFVYRMDSSVD